MPLTLLTLLTLLAQILYTTAILGLAIYGFNTLWLTWQLLRRRPALPIPHQPAEIAWPLVTVQLPVYNEYHVVERLIDACAALDYPRDRLQIQLLDDSVDGTTALAQRRVAYWQQAGIQIQILHRRHQAGFKAGALSGGLAHATGEFLAIFDADFLPPADFLKRTIPHFLLPDAQRLGFVQTRWTHLNRSYSLLTGCQALALDGHFGVEQPARQAAGYPFGFNGSAGVWRRSCVSDPAVGGWQADTLCEDLDLSYRARLAGWQARYLPDVEVPAEIPPQLQGFKRQQGRWAQGSIQTLRKLAGRVWHSSWPLPVRLQAFCHLGSYLLHPLLLLLFLATLLLLLLGARPIGPLTYLSLLSAGPSLLYLVAQRRLYPRRWRSQSLYLLGLTLLGIGLSLNNSLAIWRGLRGRELRFLRTPKFRVESAADRWQHSRYVLSHDRSLWVELALALCALVAAVAALYQHLWWALPLLMLYLMGFGATVAAGLWQGRPSHTRERVGSLYIQRSSRG